MVCGKCGGKRVDVTGRSGIRTDYKYERTKNRETLDVQACAGLEDHSQRYFLGVAYWLQKFLI
jgi:hypothetical protein